MPSAREEFNTRSGNQVQKRALFENSTCRVPFACHPKINARFVFQSKYKALQTFATLGILALFVLCSEDAILLLTLKIS